MRFVVFRARFVAALATVLALWFDVATATAQTLPGAATRGAAYEEFQAGLASARQGRWNDALDRFSRSYVLEPRSGTLLNLAGAQLQTGHLVEGIDSYRRLLREAGDSLTAGQRRAATDAIAAAQALLPHVRIDVHGLAPDDAVNLDTESLPVAALTDPIPLDPGDHAITVRRGGNEIAHASVHVELHDVRTVTLEVPPASSAPPENASSSSVASSPPPPAVASTSPPPDDLTHRVLAPRTPARPLVASPWLWLGVTAATLAIAGGALAGWYATQPQPFPGNIPPHVLHGP